MVRVHLQSYAWNIAQGMKYRELRQEKGSTMLGQAENCLDFMLYSLIRQRT